MRILEPPSPLRARPLTPSSGTCARLVAEKLKHEGKQEAKALGDLEEVEDSEGNVLSRRDYGPFLPFLSGSASALVWMRRR